MSNVSCSICLAEFTQNCELSTTPCGHIFHSFCLTRAIELNGNTCTLCRNNFEVVQIHRVYLPIESKNNSWTNPTGAGTIQIGQDSWKEVRKDVETYVITRLFICPLCRGKFGFNNHIRRHLANYHKIDPATINSLNLKFSSLEV